MRLSERRWAIQEKSVSHLTLVKGLLRATRRVSCSQGEIALAHLSQQASPCSERRGVLRSLLEVLDKGVIERRVQAHPGQVLLEGRRRRVVLLDAAADVLPDFGVVACG